MSVVGQTSRWRAAASPGGLIGLLFVILALMAMTTALLGITDRIFLSFPTILLWFIFALSFAAFLMFAFLLWAYLSINYRLAGEWLEITWGLWTNRIPLAEIRSVIPAADLVGFPQAGWQPFWPGYYVGRRPTHSGDVRIVATQPPRRQVLIRLNDGRQLAISPERPLLFMEELARWRSSIAGRSPSQSSTEEHELAQPAQRFIDAGWTSEFGAVGSEAVPQREGVVHEPFDGSESPGSSDKPLTRVYRSRPSTTSPLLRPILIKDPISVGMIVLGVIGTAAMALYVLVQYQDIPPSLTMHWNVDGLPGRVGEPREIWILPAIAGLVLLSNIALAWSIALFDRFAARLLLSATIMTHVVTWVGLLMILR